VLYRDENGNIQILGEQEKIELWKTRMTPVFGKTTASRIIRNAQAIAKLATLQLNTKLSKPGVTMIAIDSLVDKTGRLWLSESNILPTLLWYNHRNHPHLQRKLASELVKSMATQAGFRIPDSY
jgi:hypothetical protein